MSFDKFVRETYEYLKCKGLNFEVSLHAANLKGKCHEFWVFFFIGLMCLHDHNNDVYSLVFFKKNYSLRYELSKMAIFCFLPCYFLPVGVAKRDVIGGIDADKSIPL